MPTIVKFLILLALFIGHSLAIAADDPAQIPDLMKPIGKITSETKREVAPGINHVHRVTDDPLNINILIVDTAAPGVSIRACLAGDRAAGLETVRSMAARRGAIAAINGDYWTNHGIPLGLTIVDGEIIIAPKFRAAFGIEYGGRPVIGQWSDKWAWDAFVQADDGSTHPLTMMNSDLGEGWLCLYTDKYGMATKGDSLPSTIEVVCNVEHRVIEVRGNLPGIEIPSGGFVLSGRHAAGEWLQRHVRVGEHVRLELRSARPWQNLWQAVGAGPRILKDGNYFQDPIADLPQGEEFTLAWKRGHYLHRQPRSAVGVTRDGRIVIFATVDGRQREHSIGVSQKQMADLLAEFGAWDGMDLDSGGSATMVVEGEVVNRPSDKSNADGTGGRERSVANALLIFYDDPAKVKPLPGVVSPEQLELNIKY